MKIRSLVVLGVILMIALTTSVLANTVSTTVTFVIPSSVVHSVSYGASCSSSNFYFVENDATINGVQTAINVSSDSAGTSPCQDGTNPSMILNNIGSVSIDVAANFTTALPTGVTVKTASTAGGYSGATTVPHGAAVSIATSIAAQTGTQDKWWWADFDNYNSGAATSQTRTLNTHASAS